MKSKLIFLIAFLFPFAALAQRQAVQGRVHYGSLGIKDVLVVNNSAQTETRTDSLGNFTLQMQVGDLLVLADRKIETRKIRYTPDLVKNNILLISVNVTAAELDEVVINRSTITSQSLGIPMGKKYTPAERRLRTASGLDPTLGVGMMPGVSISFDAILNAINGRTKRLKKEAGIEKKEFALKKMDELFTNNFYTEILKLDTDQINGFRYYAVEDSDFIAALNEGNSNRIALKIADLAVNYRELNKDEK